MRIGSLGDIIFEAGAEGRVMAPSGFQRESAARYEEHKVAGAPPRLEFLSSELAVMTLPIRLRADMGVSLPRRMWRRCAIQGKSLHLETGSGFNPFSIPSNMREVMDKVAWEYYQSIKPDGFQWAIADTALYSLCSGITATRQVGIIWDNENLPHGK